MKIFTRYNKYNTYIVLPSWPISHVRYSENDFNAVGEINYYTFGSGNFVTKLRKSESIVSENHTECGYSIIVSLHILTLLIIVI